MEETTTQPIDYSYYYEVIINRMDMLVIFNMILIMSIIYLLFKVRR